MMFAINLPFDPTARSPATDLLNAWANAMRPPSSAYWRIVTGTAWLPSALPGGENPQNAFQALADLQRERLEAWREVAEASVRFWTTPNPWALTQGRGVPAPPRSGG